jgi:hypothetical protein
MATTAQPSRVELSLPRFPSFDHVAAIRSAVISYIQQCARAAGSGGDGAVGPPRGITKSGAAEVRQAVVLLPAPAPHALRVPSPEGGPFTHYVPLGKQVLEHPVVVRGGWLAGRSPAQVVKGVVAVLKARGVGVVSPDSPAGGLRVLPGVLLPPRAAAAGSGVAGGGGGGSGAGRRGGAPVQAPQAVLAVQVPSPSDVIAAALASLVRHTVATDLLNACARCSSVHHACFYDQVGSTGRLFCVVVTGYAGAKGGCYGPGSCPCHRQH